jgi:hypothetical protein
MVERMQRQKLGNLPVTTCRRLSELGAPEGALEAWFGRMLHSAAS